MKRLFDLFFATIGLIFLSPVFLLVSIVIRRDGGPAFFRQERVGLNGESFRIFKFRTMVQNAEKLGAQITAGKDPRITKIGHFIRNTKIDELPQLINVFLGDMSLVGPRPEVSKYVEKWSSSDRLRILSIRPGITDYASLVYSNEQEVLSGSKNPERYYIDVIMPNKLSLYRKYSAEMNIWLDCRIIIATLAKIGGHSTKVLLPELFTEGAQGRGT